MNHHRCEPPSGDADEAVICEPPNVPVGGGGLRQWPVVLALPGQHPRALASVCAATSKQAARLVFASRPLLPPWYVLVGEDLCGPLLGEGAAVQTSQRQSKSQILRQSKATMRRGTLTKAQARGVSERWRRYWLAKHPPDKPPQVKDSTKPLAVAG